MIDTPEITRTEARTAAVIHLTVPRKEMQEAFGPAMDELMSTLEDQEIAPAGPVFAHHLRMDPETFDFELGVAVSEPVAATGRVEPGKLPAAKVARTAPTLRAGAPSSVGRWSTEEECRRPHRSPHT